MTDPYQVLGVSRNASDDEIKEAYRNLSKKYHPDNFNQNETMEELANEKMSEINSAYDRIMNERRSGASASHGSSYSSYSEIRSMIENGRYTAADNELERNRNDGDAEWNFLKATVCMSRGWLNDAYTYYAKAVNLDPDNSEYRMAFNNMQARRNGQMNGNPYGSGYRRGSDASDMLCDLCQCLICANCLSNCLCN